MSNIYFFRGKAATGKTTITNKLSEKINVSVLRKDDIFDKVSKYITDNSLNNNITYDILSTLIQTNINNESDIIIDVGLANTNGLKDFLSKIDFAKAKVFYFYCDCSNMEVWKNRFEERFENPTPNQYFNSIHDIISHYNNPDAKILQNEFLVDSNENLDNIISYILSIINPAV